MAELEDKKKHQAKKAIEFGIRYGSINSAIQSSFCSPIAMQISAHALFRRDEHAEVMKLMAYHWKDLDAKLDPADVASEDEYEMDTLAIARSLSIYWIDPTDGLLQFTPDGKEALAIYKATTDESAGME